MVDDHKYSVRRIVAYRHPEPEQPKEVYGPLGPDRTYGIVLEVMLVGEGSPHWEYIVRNSFTGEVRQIAESEIFHGADCEYLDFYRRDSIFLTRESPSRFDDEDARSQHWQRALKRFLRTGVRKLREREEKEARAREEGVNLGLAPGDYVRLRGDLRPEMEQYHNLYGKVLAVAPADIEFLEIGPGKGGMLPGVYKVLKSYHIKLDNGEEADFYDVEIKAVYTTNGRRKILNWRAASFLAEAFGDEPPYQADLEYLCSHVFTRAELEGKSNEELAELLAKLIFVKGQATLEEIEEKRAALENSPTTYLVDQILALSRFDMSKNRSLTDEEIEQSRIADAKLKELFE
ncbi:MAG: hypothetical protein K6T99_07225 [Armatimonadetes bacterium]|nr:hypothetical protein [Armatimonadota bacterium]